MRNARWLGLLLVPIWVIVGLASSAGAEAGLTVAPMTGLTGGDQVTVQASGLPSGVAVRVIQCDAFYGDNPEEYCFDLATLTADATGQVTAAVTLRDPVLHVLPFGDPAKIYCRADICRIFVVWTDATGTTQVLASPPLEFVGSPATITATPNADLRKKQKVQVSGTALGAEGQTVEVVEEACFDMVEGSGCYGTLMLGSSTIQQDGSWGLRARVLRRLADGTDCADTLNILGQCQLTARILDASGQPDDSFGISRSGDPGVVLTFRT